MRLSEIDVAGLTAYVAVRRRQAGTRTGSTVAPQTILRELHALSSLFKRAVAEGRVGSNPIRDSPRSRASMLGRRCT